MMIDEVNEDQAEDNIKNLTVIAVVQALAKATTTPIIHTTAPQHLTHLCPHLLHLRPMQTLWKSFVEIGNFTRGIRQRWRNCG